MTEPFSPSRIHVVVGSPWRDAVIKHLQSDAPFQPWSAVPDAQADDGVLVVFDTEPRLVLRQVARVGTDGDIGEAIAELDHWWFRNPAFAFSWDKDMADYSPLVIEDLDAADLLAVLDEGALVHDHGDRFGHTSAAAARTLLESGGRCTSCGSGFDLSRAGAGDDITVHTADAGDDSDWPAVLCLACAAAMRDGEYESFLKFQFAQHPQCPACGARRTCRREYGLLISSDLPPWVDRAGCCPSDERWTCGSCGHGW
jgi:hypothetical protein